MIEGKWSGCRDLNPGPLAPQASDGQQLTAGFEDSVGLPPLRSSADLARSGSDLDVARVPHLTAFQAVGRGSDSRLPLQISRTYAPLVGPTLPSESQLSRFSVHVLSIGLLIGLLVGCDRRPCVKSHQEQREQPAVYFPAIGNVPAYFAPGYSYAVDVCDAYGPEVRSAQ